MTEYVPYPTETYEVGGKTTGDIEVAYQGDGRIYVNADALDFRDRTYRVNFHATVVVAYAESTVELHELHRTGGLAPVRRGVFESAPKTYGAQIMSDVKDAILHNWNADTDDAGLDAHLAQKLCSAERELSEAHDAYRAARATVRNLQKRQRCEHCGERHLADTTWCARRVDDVMGR